MGPRLNECQNWMRDYLAPRYPELVSTVQLLLEALDTASVTGSLSAGQLQVVAECAGSSRQIVSEMSSSLLGEISVNFVKVRDVILLTTGAPWESFQPIVAETAAVSWKSRGGLWRITIKSLPKR